MRLAWTRGPPWRAGWSVEARRAAANSAANYWCTAEWSCLSPKYHFQFTARNAGPCWDRQKIQQRNETQEWSCFWLFTYIFTLLLLFFCRVVHLPACACVLVLLYLLMMKLRPCSDYRGPIMLYCRWGCREPSSLVLLKNWSSETESHSRLFCVCMSSSTIPPPPPHPRGH